jgi:hypothetical protein
MVGFITAYIIGKFRSQKSGPCLPDKNAWKPGPRKKRRDLLKYGGIEII